MMKGEVAVNDQVVMGMEGAVAKKRLRYDEDRMSEIASNRPFYQVSEQKIECSRIWWYSLVQSVEIRVG